MQSASLSAPAVLEVDGGHSNAMLDQPVQGSRAWTRESLQPADWLLPLPERCLAELERVQASLQAQPLPVLMLAPDQFDLPECRRLMTRVRTLLQDGPGVALLDRLPLDRLGSQDAQALHWILGRCLAPLVAQKHDGTMIYDVRDTGALYGYGVRASVTNAELVFHTDNCFAVAPPDYVSLLCIHPAQSGGVSRFCSVYTVHNRMLQRHPQLLRRLYQPVYFDRQAEHRPGAPPVTQAVPFVYRSGVLKARLNAALVRRGYELADRRIDQELQDALQALEEIMADPALWLEFSMQRGQTQYLNNWEVVHFRSHFQDGQDEHEKRHLVRLWYRESGRPFYDG